MNHWRTQRIMQSNRLAQNWQSMSNKERKDTLAECKYAQAMITRAIQDLRIFRTTGQLPQQTDEDTDIEDIRDLEKLLRLKKNARSTLSKARKANNTKLIDKWEKILNRIELQQKTLVEP